MPSCNLFDIKRFALHDGPGIRTTLFMKGCPLRCVWCHNPEGISPEPTTLFTEKKCIHCGLHEKGGADVCPTLALQVAGKEWQIEDILKEIEKERKVMEDSGGGVTFCGGEPLMHPTELKALLVAIGKKGFHRAVDTTLFASWQSIEDILPHTELLMVDMKHMDSALHKEYTGVGNDVILANIQRLLSLPERPDVWIRIPFIEGVNADEENVRTTAEFLAANDRRHDVPVFLLPYHDTGKAKHTRMGSAYNKMGYDMRTPSQDCINKAKGIFAEYGIKAE